MSVHCSVCLVSKEVRKSVRALGTGVTDGWELLCFFIIFVYVCVGVHVCNSAYVEVQGQLVGLCLFLYHVGLGA